MRYPRLSPPREDAADPSPGPPLVAVAHGSTDPRAAATIGSLLGLVRSRAPGLAAREAFLGHAAPSVAQVLGSLAPGPVVVLPLLLTAAYHSKSDLPATLARHGRLDISYGRTLGPHPLLLEALSRRLAASGAIPNGHPHDLAETGVVLAAAGSSDPAANATVARLAARWQRSAGWGAVVPGYASAASPSPAAAVSALLASGSVRRVVVATYLLAPGFFADKIRSSSLAAGAAAVSPALGAMPEVADVILERYSAAAAALTGTASPAAGAPPAAAAGR
jgi:sirohydrochlorin ferrochelatase